MTDTTIPDNSFGDATTEAAPVRKSTAKQKLAGIGHNSADAGGEMSRAETFSADIAEIDRAIRVVDDLEIAAEQSKLPSRHAALVLLYAFLVRVSSMIPLTRFCELMGIDAHGNAKNPLQPTVAWFWRNYEEGYVRQTVWRWSAALAVAIEAGISVEDFPAWLNAHGVEKLVRKYQETAARSKTEADIAAEETVANSICACGDDAPAMPGTRITSGKEPGRRLVVIDILSSKGEFQVLTVLPASSEQIRKMLVNEARKRSSRGA